VYPANSTANQQQQNSLEQFFNSSVTVSQHCFAAIALPYKFGFLKLNDENVWLPHLFAASFGIYVRELHSIFPTKGICEALQYKEYARFIKYFIYF
jgi:hypothetical protein